MEIIYMTKSLLEKATKERTELLETQEKPRIYRENLDQLTIRMSRKKELGTWAEQDSKDYKIAYNKCVDLIKIEESKIVPDNIQIVSDEEYAKLLEELESKEDIEVKEVVNGE